MIFQFRIWGLVLLFILITLNTFSRSDSKRKSNYGIILFTSYLLEFFYIICYIVRKINIDRINILFSRIYYVLFVIVLFLYLYYFIQLILKNKYKLKDTVYESNILNFKRIVIGICFVMSLVMIFIRSSYMWKFILIISSVITFLHFILILKERKYLDRREYYSLLGFSFIELILISFQIEFAKVEVLGTMIILLSVYLYFVLENSSIQKEKDLILLKEYGDKNTIIKQEFLRKLSHEIRIPINTIDGFSQMIEEGKDLNEIKEDAKDIRMASLELIDLVNSMIDLSILESGELKIINENYNVYDNFDDFVKMVTSRLKSKKVIFKSNIDKDIPVVLKGDVDRINQVVLNIISNSIKYTDKGNIELSVSSIKSKNICRLVLKITDTGKGMDQEEVNHLLNNEDDEKGIGLKISKYLLDLMNGKMDIDSAVGKGTCITISIDQEIISMKEDKTSKKSKEIQIVSFKGKRVLLVDDNKLNLKVASKLLSYYDIDVVTVTSGQECLDLLDTDHQFDLILMDDLMPNMSGVETLDVLRKIERVNGYYIPVVVLTANAVSGMRDKYLSVGFDDYLSKPIDREELDRVLKEFFIKNHE